MTERELSIHKVSNMLHDVKVMLEPCSSYISLKMVNGTSFRVEIDGNKYYWHIGQKLHGSLTYFDDGNKGAIPIAGNSIGFTVDFSGLLESEPKKVRIVFDRRIAHPNVFPHATLCTGEQTNMTTLCELVEKALRTVIFDPGIANLNSRACSDQYDWYCKENKKGNFPLTDIGTFLGRGMGKPKVIRRG